MPFKSYAQEAYLKHNHPEIYKRWIKKYGSYKGKKKHINESRSKAVRGRS